MQFVETKIEIPERDADRHMTDRQRPIPQRTRLLLQRIDARHQLRAP
jgi:hypothetical protein